MKYKYGCLGFLLLLLLTTTGCGDLFGKKVVDKPLDSDRFRADCELDMDEFSEILEKPITQTINCLEKNINIFMDVSELGRGGKLSRVALLKYLKRNRPELKPNALAMIDSVFTLSHLITGETEDFISKKNVAAIVDLVRTFNKYSARHYSYTFGSEAPANLPVHESHRMRVEEAATEIKNALQLIYVADRGYETHSVDIMEIAKSFVKDGDQATLDKIEGLLFAKKILAGGDPKVITHKELGFIFNNLPKLMSLVLDGVRYQYLEFPQRDLLKFIHDDVVDLSNILFHPERGDRNYEVMVNTYDAIKGIDNLIKEDEDKIWKFRKLLIEAKRIITLDKEDVNLPAEDWILGKDLLKIFDHVYNVTKKGMAFHALYNSPQFKTMLDAPQSVYINPKDYELQFPTMKTELKDFARVVNDYRYMRGSFALPIYSLDHRRNANGIAQISLFEYGIKRFFTYKGSSTSMGAKTLQGILKSFENELIDLNIILPRRARNTAETISLLGSLFQSQSDDSDNLDLPEATEFAVILFSAMDAKKDMMEFYKVKVAEDSANCHMDEFDRINPACFNKYFFNNLCTNYKDNFPRLFEYMGVKNPQDCNQNFNTEHNKKYLSAAEYAARVCQVYPDDNSEIAYSEGDIMSMLIAMMHIETTITRWDVNLNNQMDKEEVLESWKIYHNAIIGMLPDAIKKLPPKLQDTLGKLVFQYLVKFEEAPKLEGKDIWKTIGNLAKLLVKKEPATRKAIAMILKAVSEQSAKKAEGQGEKPFDCNWMRDPNNIPRD